MAPSRLLSRVLLSVRSLCCLSRGQELTVTGQKRAIYSRVSRCLLLVTLCGGLVVLYLSTHLPISRPLIWSLLSAWLLLGMVIVDKLTPPVHANGLQRIRESWKMPSDSITALSPWPKDFSQGITPVQCHSHNDYWRNVPLFDALTAGCVGVEADVWLDKTSNDLLVGHRTSSLSADRTLQSLYIKPLTTILTRINQGANFPVPRSGVFETLPNASLTLLIDVKTDGHTSWPVVMDQLGPLRAGGWLSYWNRTGDGLAWRPIIVVGTGNTPFELVNADAEYRDVFFDAPLDQLADNASFTANNSYYTSTSLRKAAGIIWPWGPSRRQKETMKRMIDTAAARGLVSRFWGIPGWPVGLRMKLWRFLEESRIGTLNVDKLFEATQWIRDWCTVARWVLC